MLYPTPTFFLFEQFPSFIFLLKPFIGDREKNNIHLRQDTLRCCKKKSQHKTTIDIRILLCAWGIIHLHSAKLCNRDVEKNCRNWFEDKQRKKCFCWAIIRFACQIRCLFLCSIQTKKMLEGNCSCWYLHATHMQLEWDFCCGRATASPKQFQTENTHTARNYFIT